MHVHKLASCVDVITVSSHVGQQMVGEADLVPVIEIENVDIPCFDIHLCKRMGSPGNSERQTDKQTG